MVSFLTPATGGIQPINGRNGATIEGLINAERGKPGKDIVPNVVNQIIAATQVSVPANACDPQAALQRAQQQIQEKVQLILVNYIQQQVQQEVSNSASIQQLQKELQAIQQTQNQTESIQQQAEIIEKDMQKQLSGLIVGVVGRASQQLPQVAKLANTNAAGLKTIATVAESLSTFVPSQGINMSAYASATQKTVQTVSQACYI
ncbi:hypothetical protein [Microcoleus sp. D2_18a_B4]|uniref:hypothetical protein n=1 Tax=Microcoleus sp. D2_18a_B4 TaxID=3055329 RepID=UPI002FCF5B76